MPVCAEEEPSPVVEPGEGAFDDPAVTSEAGAVLGLASRDHGFDAALPQLLAVAFGVVAAVGEQTVRPSSGSADTATDGRYLVEQSEQLGDVVAVAAG